EQRREPLVARGGDRFRAAATRPPSLGQPRHPRQPRRGRLDRIPGPIARARPHATSLCHGPVAHGILCPLMNDRATSTALMEASPVEGTLASLLAKVGAQTKIPFRAVFADGSEYWNHEAAPAFTLFFRSKKAQSQVIRFGHVGLLEAYFDGGIDFEGDFAK